MLMELSFLKGREAVGDLEVRVTARRLNQRRATHPQIRPQRCQECSGVYPGVNNRK